MIDKMMRVAGRTENGIAKSVKTDKNGRLLTGNDSVIFLNEEGSGGGREILAGITWESSLFDGDGLDRLTINTMLNGSEPYEVRVIECVSLASGSIVNKTTHNLSNGNIVGSSSLEVALTGLTNKFKITVTNKGVGALKIGLLAYGSGDNTLKYYDTNQKSFKQQSQIATESTLNKYITNTNVLMNEAGSGGGREILAGITWESELLNVEGIERLLIDTMLNNGEPYRMTVYEYMFLPTGGTKEITKHELSNGGVVLNQHFETYLSGSANRIRVTISNIGESSLKIGLHVVGSKWSYLNYYNETDKKFVPQQQIATEDTLAKIVKALRQESIPKKPILKKVKVVDPSTIYQVLEFANGKFYACGKNRNTLYTSVDGETWEVLKQLNFTDTVAGITKVLVGDTGHILAGNLVGEVFISDENGTFSNTPNFTTGRLSPRYGKFKHENVLGFSCYDDRGFAGTGKHEAWLSLDNGATYAKIFDNTTLQSLITKYPIDQSRPDNFENGDPEVHLHDIEYDPHSGRLYIWQGDMGTVTFYYSDDWGKNWEMAFQRGVAGNQTQVIAVKDGIAFGGDTTGGGVSFLRLDRSQYIRPELDINNYDNEHWKFSDGTDRYVAGGKFVDREKGIFLLPYISEYDDTKTKNGYIAYSGNGIDWEVLWETPTQCDQLGLENIFYGNGKLVGNYVDNYVDTASKNFKIMSAEVTF